MNISVDLPSVHSPSSRVLSSWKDIARYMGKGVRTVQRWERDFGLPVRRARGANRKAILARPADLDAWVALQCPSRNSGTAVVGQKTALVADGAHLRTLMLLNTQMETSRMLRYSMRTLMSEVHQAVDRLRCQIDTLQSMQQILPGAAQIPFCPAVAVSPSAESL
jgi:hypothetical protein